ncbi:hypothetical protein [Streptomyces sioyaensis]|uniref:hypothetical protein n=1 Tax=Streptomyces sioyaensis TaxID=67364 RepID=UPI003711BB8F
MDDFSGRQAELDSMTRFALVGDDAEGGQPYWRWLAPAWAGKTTLMAHFVLEHLPRIDASVDVLAFFIARRQAGQSDRTAFLMAMQRQLREYLDERELEILTVGQFLDSLERAGEQAGRTGRRLLLVVDGLDEDTGPASAVDGYSIAALLPRTPPSGVRVIVAGRPNPPVPADVPDRHPLRDQSIDHVLGVSQAARATQVDAERDLRALINGDSAGRQIVGLTAAAGGGLSAADLAALVDPPHSPRELELILGGSLGRSFQTRDAQWMADRAGPTSVYSFAHDVLLDTAADLLAHEIDKYRQRLHAYANSWQQAGWPPGTPEWLLTGYPQLLRHSGDTPRMTALAIDQTRHERLWRTTGTDVEALAEIADAFTLQRAAQDPDILACARLARRREALGRASTSAPAPLILAWARIGQVRRALRMLQARQGSGNGRLLLEVYAIGRHWPGIEQLVGSSAREMTDSGGEEWLLADVAKAFAANRRASAAAALVGKMGDPEYRARALGGVARVLAEQGLAREATTLTEMITDPTVRVRALADTAKAAALPDVAREAVSLAREIADPEHAAEALADAVGALAAAGLGAEAAAVARETTDPFWKSLALLHVGKTLARFGPVDEARALVGEIRELSEATRKPGRRRKAGDAHAPFLWSSDLFWSVGSLPVMARAVAESGEADRAGEMVVVAAAVQVAGEMAAAGRTDAAVALVRTIDDPFWRVSSLANVARALVRDGRIVDAHDLIEECCTSLGSITHLPRREQAISGLAHLLASSGRMTQATNMVQGIASPSRRESAVITLATVLAEAGEADRASELVRTINDHNRGARALADLAGVLARAGRAQEAAALAREIMYDSWEVAALTGVAKAQVGNGGITQATALFSEAAEVARNIGDPDRRASTLATLATAVARAGLTIQAVALVREITTPQWRTTGLAEVALVLAESGHTDAAVDLAGEATDAVRGGATAHTDVRSQVDLVAAVLETGRFDVAVELARDIRDPTSRDRALALVARALATSGDARTAAEMIFDIADGFVRRRTLPTVVRGLIESGDFGKAMGLISEVPGLVTRRGLVEEVVHALARVGEVETALSLVERAIDNPAVQDRLVRDLMPALAEAGQTQYLIRWARGRYDDGALVALVTFLVTSGQFEEAMTAVRSIVSPAQRDGSLAHLVGALIDAGLHEPAAGLARKIAGLEERDNALAKVVFSLASAGRSRAAVEIAEEIAAPALAEDALIDAARSLAASGQHGRALELSREIMNDSTKAGALSGAAEVLAASGKLERAAAVVREITDPEIRTRALADLAKAWGASPKGRQVLAEALDCQVPWSEHLASATLAVATDSASAIRTLAAVLYPDAEPE